MRRSAHARTAAGSPPGEVLSARDAVGISSEKSSGCGRPMQEYSDCYRQSSGFSLVELTVTLTAFAIIALAFLSLFSSLVRSTIIAKRQAVASTLATGQMEYLKSLPYDSLAVAGGTIYSASPLPATSTQTINGVKYTIKTSINYVDDAYDGCGSYPTQAQKEQYCRNYPPPSGSPTTDLNPKDYKIAHVNVTDKTGSKLAEVDTQMSARVSETSSTTGALFVSVIDNNGNKISGATVTVTDTTVTPNVNMSDSTDANGTAIFYDLPPDTNNFDFIVNATKTNYSSLTTISPNGTLQPTYPSQKVFTQQSSYVTLTLKLQGVNSLLIETTNTSGAALAGAKVYAKGGYKKYTLTSDTAYYFDNMSPSDTRPTTDASGLAAFSSLVPGSYIFCGDAGATSCSVGGTTYYLTAAVPYGGTNFNPVEVPTYDASSPPTTTFAYGGNNYLQKVRLMLTTTSNWPRVQSLTPSNVSLASGTIAIFPFTITGVNLPCTATPGTCGTTVRFLQNGFTYTASCTGTSGGTSLSCTVDLTGVVQGIAQLEVIANTRTLTLPGAPLLGGLIVNP